MSIHFLLIYFLKNQNKYFQNYGGNKLYCTCVYIHMNINMEKINIKIKSKELTKPKLKIININVSMFINWDQNKNVTRCCLGDTAMQ